MKEAPQHNSAGIDEEFLEQRSAKITEEDIRTIEQKSETIKEKFEQGPLQRFVEDGKLLLEIVHDYRSGRYTKFPWWALTAIAATLLYVFNPFDLIPEFIPGIGLIDDAAVVATCLAFIEQELLIYRTWKKNRSV